MEQSPVRSCYANSFVKKSFPLDSIFGAIVLGSVAQICRIPYGRVCKCAHRNDAVLVRCKVNITVKYMVFMIIDHWRILHSI